MEDWLDVEEGWKKVVGVRVRRRRWQLSEWVRWSCLSRRNAVVATLASRRKRQPRTAGQAKREAPENRVFETEVNWNFGMQATARVNK